MHSPFTADFWPPTEAPPGVDPDMVSTWATNAERWDPDDEVRDRVLVSMLARAEQDALPRVLRELLVVEAQRTLAAHVANAEGVCVSCTRRHNGFQVPYPCWGVLLARRVVPGDGWASVAGTTGGE